MYNDKDVKGELGYALYKPNGTLGKFQYSIRESLGATYLFTAGYKCPKGYTKVAAYWRDKYKGHTNRWYSAAIKCK